MPWFLRLPLQRLLRAGLLLGVLAPGLTARAADPTPVRVCANQSLGAPNDDNSAFLLARLAFEQVPELRPLYTSLPWQRCLSEAAAGHFDAVLSASYTGERAQGLAYPLDAQGRPEHRLRMFQVGYVLFKRKDSPVHWDGLQFSGTSARAGEAIGAERGYSIVAFARERGAVVEDRYPQFGSLIDSLKLRRIAAILVNQEGAASLLTDPVLARDHEIHGPPLQQKGYFMPVSHAFAKAQPQAVERLWEALARSRQSPAFQQRFSLAMSGGRRKDIAP